MHRLAGGISPSSFDQGEAPRANASGSKATSPAVVWTTQRPSGRGCACTASAGGSPGGGAPTTTSLPRTATSGNAPRKQLHAPARAIACTSHVRCSDFQISSNAGAAASGSAQRRIPSDVTASSAPSAAKAQSKIASSSRRGATRTDSKAGRPSAPPAARAMPPQWVPTQMRPAGDSVTHQTSGLLIPSRVPKLWKSRPSKRDSPSHVPIQRKPRWSSKKQLTRSCARPSRTPNVRSAVACGNARAVASEATETASDARSGAERMPRGNYRRVSPSVTKLVIRPSSAQHSLLPGSWSRWESAREASSFRSITDSVSARWASSFLHPV